MFQSFSCTRNDSLSFRFHNLYMFISNLILVNKSHLKVPACFCFYSDTRAIIVLILEV